MKKFLCYVVITTLVFTAGLIWGVRASNDFLSPLSQLCGVAWGIFLYVCYRKAINNKVAASGLPEKITSILIGMGIFISMAVWGLAYIAVCYFFPNSGWVHQFQPWEKAYVGFLGSAVTIGLVIAGVMLYLENRRLSRS